jgi:hypothetical protein
MPSKPQRLTTSAWLAAISVEEGGLNVGHEEAEALLEMPARVLRSWECGLGAVRAALDSE